MTRKPRTVSEAVGLMRGPDGAPRRVYRALVELRCCRCGAVLPPGAMFARRSARLGPPRALPHCQRCFALRPLDTDDADDADGARGAL